MEQGREPTNANAKKAPLAAEAEGGATLPSDLTSANIMRRRLHKAVPPSPNIIAMPVKVACKQKINFLRHRKKLIFVFTTPALTGEGARPQQEFFYKK